MRTTLEYLAEYKRRRVDAHYKKDYLITKEELEYLSERVDVLKGLVERVCGERLG